MIGAGLSGLAASDALSRRGYRVTLLERKSIPGGRASSYEAQDTGEPVDNCQHVLMRCCTNLLRFYEQCGVADRIRWTSRLSFLERDGRESVLHGSRLPAPFHLLPSFFRLRFLDPRDKWGVARALVTMLRRPDPPDEPASAWLKRAGQSPRAVQRFWRPILVSALNEEPERCGLHAVFKIFREGFLGHPRAFEMGVPSVPLLELYGPCVRSLQARGVEVRFRAPVRALRVEGGLVSGVALDGETLDVDCVVSTVPFGDLGALLGENHPARIPGAGLEPSPITAVHLWWDRCVTARGHAVLLDRQVQWMFNKTADFGRAGDGTYMGLVVSASRDWLPLPRREILAVAEREIRDAFPAAREATVLQAAVIKEARATFSPAPGTDALRPEPVSALPGLFLGGDWIRNGWPSTMEAAVRGGLLAAQAVLAAHGRPEALLAPDLAWQAVLGRAA